MCVSAILSVSKYRICDDYSSAVAEMLEVFRVMTGLGYFLSNCVCVLL